MADNVVKVTRKYQITIPKEVREKVGVMIGDELRVVDKGEFIILKKRRKGKSLLELAGCWKGYPEDADEFMEELRKIWSTWKL